MILSIILVGIFLILAILHLSWVLGSTWGFDSSIPKTEDGSWVIKPGKKDSLMVGLGLLFFAIFYLIQAELIDFDLPKWALSIAGWLIPIIFLFRAIGDFKYIGFFKKVKATRFAQLDSRFYSPLCLIISLIGFIVRFT